MALHRRTRLAPTPLFISTLSTALTEFSADLVVGDVNIDVAHSSSLAETMDNAGYVRLSNGFTTIDLTEMDLVKTNATLIALRQHLVTINRL